MKRLTIRHFWVPLVALAFAVPAWSQGHAELPQPGILMISRTTAKTGTLTVEAGRAYSVGWLQQGTFRNVTINVDTAAGEYTAYLTENIGPGARLIDTKNGPPASGSPLFQVASLGPGNYFVVLVRRSPDGVAFKLNVGGPFAVIALGTTIQAHTTNTATYTTGNPYEANFTLYPPSNGQPRFSVTAQWTNDPSVAFGPNTWGLVGPPADTCGFRTDRGIYPFGQTQSPINIVTANAGAAGGRTLTFSYGTALPYVIENTGNTIEVPGSTNSYLTYNGVRYNLVQFHVHATSEHTLNGKSYALEAHLVHRNDLGQLAVVGVLFDSAVGASRTALDTMIENSPENVGTKEKANSTIPVDFVPTSGNFYFYNGSLTTPPCTEGVTWIVAADTKTILPATLTTLHNLIKKFPSYNNYENNNRPIVPSSSGRPVVKLR